MGIFFISINNMAKNCTIAEFFPSPMENFFISMLELETNGNLEDIEFPFPMGIFFVSIKEGALYAKGTDSFRPLRGSFLFLFFVASLFKCEIDTVSVPYGDLFCFYCIIALTIHSVSRFPSPTGLFFVSIIHK